MNFQIFQGNIRTNELVFHNQGLCWAFNQSGVTQSLDFTDLLSKNKKKNLFNIVK